MMGLFDLFDCIVEEYYGITHEQLLSLDRDNLLTDEELDSVIAEAIENPQEVQTPNKELVANKLK